MTPLTRISNRMSEIRQRLGEIAALEGDDYTDEIAAENSELQRELTRLEPQLRAARLAAGDDAEPQPAAAGGAAPSELAGRIQLREYLSGALSGNGIDANSAEGELNVELGLDTDMIPLEAFASDASQGTPMRVDRPLQQRADVATTVPSDVMASQAPIGQRVFAGSILEFCGVMMPTVPRGERTYPVLTAGSAAATVAKGAAQEATAGTITSLNLAPVRGQIRYQVQLEDLAVMDLEPTLRADGRAALTEHLSDRALNGSGTAPQVQGLFAALTNPTAGSTVMNFDLLLAGATGGIDGLWASMLSQRRLLLGANTYRLATGQFKGDELAVLDYLRAQGCDVRASSLIAAPSSDNQAALGISTGGPGPKAVLPVWQGIQVIRDNTSDAASGKVNLTLNVLYNFRVLRTAAYQELTFHLA
ncbi:MAG: phage major capsid protein [Gemmatimonadales bacterium]|nr:phage major capsid protein [Candidatus Palauibacter ramosifaciens]